MLRFTFRRGLQGALLLGTMLFLLPVSSLGAGIAVEEPPTGDPGPFFFALNEGALFSDGPPRTRGDLAGEVLASAVSLDPGSALTYESLFLEGEYDAMPVSVAVDPIGPSTNEIAMGGDGIVGDQGFLITIGDVELSAVGTSVVPMGLTDSGIFFVMYELASVSVLGGAGDLLASELEGGLLKFVGQIETSVPEPGTWLLLGLAGLAVAGARRGV